MSASMTASASDSVPTPETIDDLVLNRNIYLLPEFLTPNEANEKARPNESPAKRAARVTSMAASIKSGRQNQPVLVMEFHDTYSGGVWYEYVDGGSRVDAISLLNQSITDPAHLLKVWCSIIPDGVDAFRTAVVSNIQREGNSILELCAIIKETEERNGWAGKRGSNKKVSEFLGMPESRVVELKKIGDKATPKLRAMIESGEISSVDAALKLVGLPDDKIDSIADRAAEIAGERAADKAATATQAVKVVEVTDPVTGEVTQVTEPMTAQETEAAQAATGDGTTAPTVTTGDVRQAATEAGETVGPLSKKEILEFFVEKCGPAYPESVKRFCENFVDSYAKGTGTLRTANKYFDIMTAQSPETKAANKAAAKAADEAAKAEAKAAADKAKKRGPKSGGAAK